MKTFITSLLLLTSYVLLAQTVFQREKRDYTWRIGVQPIGDVIEPSIPVEDTKLSFVGDSVYLSYILSSTWLMENNAMMCDTAGNLLFYTNGLWVVDSTEQLMPHGDTLNSDFYSLLYDTLNNEYYFNYSSEDWMIQGSLALPDPGNPERYYLLHSRWYYFDSLPGSQVNEVGRWIYYSVIDMTEHGGLGDIIEKRTLLVEDTMSGFTPRLKACRHANGRDWWIPVGMYPNKYNMYLLDPTGFHLVNEQTFDYNEYYGNGQAVFSADGTKYARFAADSTAIESMVIRLFDFDRCSGQLSQNKLIYLPYSDFNTEGSFIGLSFSPNGRFLYLNSYKRLYQIDLWDSESTAELIVYLEPDEEEKSFFLVHLALLIEST
jgi:WD40 repeat protein